MTPELLDSTRGAWLSASSFLPVFFTYLIATNCTTLCRHFSNRTEAQHGDYCDQRLGAISMPAVMAKLKQIGAFISQNRTHLSILTYYWDGGSFTLPGGTSFNTDGLDQLHAAGANIVTADETCNTSATGPGRCITSVATAQNYCSNATITDTFKMKVLVTLGAGIFDFKNHTLFVDWVAAADSFISAVKPLIASGCVVGVMIGDEIICGGTNVRYMEAVAAHLKKGLGPKSWIYTNEADCMLDPAIWIPAGLDGE